MKLDYEEVHWNEDDLLVDHMTTHSGSSNGGAYLARCGTARAVPPFCAVIRCYTSRFSACEGAGWGVITAQCTIIAALFTTISHEAATHPTLGTLASLPGRTAVSPSYKFPACMRTALPEGLRGMPRLGDAARDGRGVGGGAGHIDVERQPRQEESRALSVSVSTKQF